MDVNEFHRELFSWWADNKREFPWRETNNPYFILVSEFMLQQTQANRVVSKYLAFTKKFSSPNKLASSSVEDVLQMWMGLGYNRRALWLREAAIKIVELGEVPQEPTELLKFKGIGSYSSRSIPIFAYNLDFAAVDTNVRKVLLEKEFISIDSPKRRVQEIAVSLVPIGQSRDYHNALMDYGAIVLSQKRINKSNKKLNKFKGSTRELRGKLLRTILADPGISVQKVERLFNSKKMDINVIIDDFIKEGFIYKNNSQLFII